ncbi:MAG: AAA family ATPase [Alphaproteobacteria bacterium]|nr:AAA family ATPase [Alphaproteobacteria bacterium]
MPKATDSDGVLRAFDPWRQLGPDDDDLWVNLWAAREEIELGRALQRELRSNDALLRVLVIGHRGTGKTTELRRLGALLRRDHIVRELAIDDVLEMEDLSLVDLVLALLKEVLDLASTHDLALPGQLLDNLKQWGLSVTRTLVHGWGVDFDATSPLGLLQAIVGRLNVVRRHRVEVRQVIEPVLSDLLQITERLSQTAHEQAVKQGKGGIVLVIDGLDRMRYAVLESGLSAYEELLVLNAPQLQRFKVHLVMAAPVGLSVQSRADQHWQLQHVSNVKLRTREGALIDAHRAELVRLVSERADIDRVFESGRAAVEQAAEWSGGNVRDLLRIIHGAARLDFSPRIADAKLRQAAERYGSDLWARTVEQAERSYLDEVGDGARDLTADARLQRLLQLGIMLHYRNARHWCAVHPCVRLVRGASAPGSR